MFVHSIALLMQLGQGPTVPAGIGEEAALRHANGRAPAGVRAVRASRAPVLDGVLDDPVWRTAVPASGFRQVQPVDGSDPSERTEVRIAFDNDALYIGARMFDSDPNGVVALLTRRDNDYNSDLFTVIIDSYHDHRTAFRFRTNPRGVKEDGITTNDNSFGDEGWDPVWEVVTRIDSLGWVAEMRVPFSQLRFNRLDAPTWGINFTRQIVRRNEFDRWSWAPNTEQGFASQFGHLLGLRDIPQPRRLEVLPYTVLQSRHQEGPDRANPFDDGSVQRLSGGIDLKYGLTSGLTLDATVNPDFGQVEADPAVVNLTAFESYFEERRPFFVEGANLFQFGAGAGGFIFGAPQLFYSRRIGGAPSRGVGAPAGGYVDQPDATTIMGAGKVSGQVGRWSLGLLSAVTAREQAQVRRADLTDTSLVVEPLTAFNVVSLRRAFRGGSSGIGVIGTGVNRRLDDDALDFLRSSAYSTGLDFFHRFGHNQYSVSGTVSATTVAGDSTAMIAAQRSSARYYQRPDQSYVAVDSTATSLSGYAVSLTAGKVSGNWVWGSDFYAYSPGFEANDGGYMTNVDQLFHGFRLTRRWTRPGRVFRQFSINSTWAQTWNFGGVRTGRTAYLGLNGQLRNFWYAGISGSYSPARLADRQTRGGPLMQIPAQTYTSAYIQSDHRRAVAVSSSISYARNAEGGTGRYLSASATLRPTTALTLTFAPSLSQTHELAQFVASVVDPLATTTSGRRYLFATVDGRTLDLTMRADLALSPTLSLQVYAQPFIASRDFSVLKELARPRTFDFVRYGLDGGSTISYDDSSAVYTVDPDGAAGPAAAFGIGNRDFLTRSLLGNVVLRWEYRPGATLFLVWNHGQSGVTADPQFRFGPSFRNLLNDRQTNTLLIKASYWLSM